ncbi:exosortase K [Porticoccus sp. W117]|uniref:exosortase K n=1 Tax=Porticoccus sp. W117 TaxID=3054777 RepID=UPI00259A7F3B|nr:exosortase K [Porticoccus sp. W117]MDM3871067.1 exosortase K [Porticoccus sp. W117]
MFTKHFSALGWGLLWWPLSLGLALLLKQHYSAASIAELNWIMQPLAILLEWFSGHHFLQGSNQDGNLEWFSYSADVRLVKGCAGINFMILSLMVYCWVLQPKKPIHQAVLLPAAALAAWATSLLANSLRILIAMTAARQQWDWSALGIDDHQQHRLIGIAVYLPLLSAQTMLKQRQGYLPLILPVVLYALLMAAVPLITGNAFHQPQLFKQHLTVILLIAVLCGTMVIFHRLFLTRTISQTSTQCSSPKAQCRSMVFNATPSFSNFNRCAHRE